MASGRRHHGRPTHLNSEHSTRTVNRSLSAESRGRGFWQRSHNRKNAFTTFCEALKTERANYGGLFNIDGRTHRLGTYPCGYGNHWLITSAPRHWHIGRPMC